MNEPNGTMRRLAVLVDSLDSQSAGRFLNNVPTRTAEQIRRYVVDLGKVSRSEREQVLQQFLFAVNGVQETVLNSQSPAAAGDRVRSVAPSALPAAQVAVSKPAAADASDPVAD